MKRTNAKRVKPHNILGTISSHCSLSGNEKADEATKAAIMHMELTMRIGLEETEMKALIKKKKETLYGKNNLKMQK